MRNYGWSLFLMLYRIGSDRSFLCSGAAEYTRVPGPAPPRAQIGVSPNWGGKREKQAPPAQRWCHPDARGAKADRLARVRNAARGGK